MDRKTQIWWENVADIYDEIADNPEAFIDCYTCSFILDLAALTPHTRLWDKLKEIWSWRREYEATLNPIPRKGYIRRTEDATYHFAVYMADEIRTLLEDYNDE